MALQQVMFDWGLFYEILAIVLYCLGCAGLTVYILHYYTKKNRMQPGIFFFLFLTYFINFFSLALITIDLSTGNFSSERGSDAGSVAAKPYMIIFWKIVYWTIQILSWIIIPLCQSYVETGEFSFIRRLWASVLENIILYAILFVVVGLLAGGFLIYLLSQGKMLSPSAIVGLGQSLSNLWGLILLTFLLGNGIVSFPRYLWHQGHNERKLSFYHFQAYKCYENVDDTKEKLYQILAEVRELDMKIPEEHKLRQYVSQIAQTVARDLEKHSVGSLDTSTAPSVEDLTYKYLTKLHKKVIYAIRMYNAAEYQWMYLQEKAYFLEDIIESQSNSEHILISPFRLVREGALWSLFYKLEWFYYCKFRKVMYRAFAVMFIVFAAILLWCQFAIPLQKLTGIRFSVFFYGMKGLYLTHIKVLIQLFSLAIVLLNATVIYYSLFKIEIFNLYRLIPHHTDSASLLFSAVFLCRVIPTLCYNYLQIVGVSQENEIAFFQVMGTLRLTELSIVGDVLGYVEDFFPFFIVIFSFIAFFSIVERVASCLGIKRRFVYDEQLDDEEVRAGRDLLSKERKRKLGKLLVQQQLRDEDDEESPSTTGRSVTSKLKQYAKKHRRTTSQSELLPTSSYGSNSPSKNKTVHSWRDEL